MNDKYKPLCTWRFHQLFVAMEQVARIADDALCLLESHAHYPLRRHYYPFPNSDGDGLSVQSMPQSDYKEMALRAQDHFRMQLVDVLRQLGMESDAAALVQVSRTLKQMEDNE
jgi:hypothetical protein